MFLSEATQRDLCQEARESAPREICGFVLSDGTTEYMNNVNEIDGEWCMERRAAIAYRMKHMGQIAGTYHSHPKGKINPSIRDVEHCPPSWAMWIVTPTEVWRWFRHGQGWIGVFEPTFGAAVLSRGADGFRPQSTSVALVSGGGRPVRYVSVAWVDEVGGDDQSLSDRIRQEADT